MKKCHSPLLAGSLLLVSLYSCQQNNPPVIKKTFLETANMDSTVRPGDNFYLYVNGSWIKKTPIPPTETEVGSFLDLWDRNQTNLHNILESAAKSHTIAGSPEQKAGDLYASGMDSAAIEKRGYDPVKPYLQEIDRIQNADGIVRFLASRQIDNAPVLMGQFIGADEKNSNVNIVSYYQAGLGLPDRDYYFRTDVTTLEIVKAYLHYMQKLYILTGDDTATASKRSMGVYALEKQLAASHRTKQDLRDPQSNYHKIAVAELDKNMPAIHWPEFLFAVGVKADSLNIRQPAYYARVNELLKTADIGMWRDYLRFHVLDEAANALSSKFVNAHFEYSGKTLNGQQVIKPRWQRLVRTIDENMGECLGQLYVKKYFTEDAKKRVSEMVDNLQTVFDGRIGELDWMTDSTKQKAKEKLHAFLKKIGYPDKWRDHSKVTIGRDHYFENLVSCGRNEYQYQLQKAGKPVDRTEWDMTPPTIDARYNPSFNEIAFAAGILQYPFFDSYADDAINYGGIGMVIGHEMTHGFDDHGAQYDKDGNIRNWWAKEDEIKFKAKGQQVVNQYSSSTILDTMHINGRLTMGEAIADIGGLAIAYEAFKKTKQGQGKEKIDGFTPDQRFFISFAQIWRWKVKEETQRLRVVVDPHAPPGLRVNETLMNFTPFYTAFDVKAGDRLFLPDSLRIKIW
jgi:putative endopeptidase